MTELENEIPSLNTILPLAGVPGFPQDTAVKTKGGWKGERKKSQFIVHYKRI